MEPAFPADWKHASIRTPDFAFDFKDKTYKLSLTKSARVRFGIPVRSTKVRGVTVNGKPVKFTIEPWAGYGMLRVQLPETKQAALVVDTVGEPVQLPVLTREEAAGRVRASLERFYTDPSVQFSVEQYVSNRITVLGRVQNPGLLSFDHPPTLLETLAKAGSLPVIDKQATLTRCAIFRGRDKVIWVDLKRLLNGGQTHLNLRMQPGDLVYIPDSADTMVYVLGAVHRPGAYRLTPDMSVMDALATAGGPNEDGQPNEIGVYRPARQAVERISLQNLMGGRQRVNFALEEGDVIFVPKSGIAEFGYFMRQIAPGLSLLTIGAAVGL